MRVCVCDLMQGKINHDQQILENLFHKAEPNGQKPEAEKIKDPKRVFMKNTDNIILRV